MPPPVQPGQVIKGKYRVDRVLGEGGMGVVVAGHHVGLNQRCAIKFLHTAMLAHPEIVERFGREARAASKLESDHVARVTDVDALDDGTPFMVMEYLEGIDLATVRASGTPLALTVAASYIIEACEAFAEAHAHGIVHRDIKPANLFLAKRAGGKTRVKVLDFGISKMGSADGDAGVTRTSSVMGSAHYMSPEQMLTPREVDLRTDIWALGVTLFELTTARLPFPGESLTQVCAMVMSMQPPAPSSVRADLPPSFDAVVKRCLGRHPSERYASVAELVAALEQFVRPGASSLSSPSLPVPDATTWRLTPEAAAAARAGLFQPDMPSSGSSPGSDPRASANPPWSQPGSDPRHGAPGSDPRLGTPGSDPRLGTPGSDPRLGVPGSDPRFGTALLPSSPSHPMPGHGPPAAPTELPLVPKKSSGPIVIAAVLGVLVVAGIGIGLRATASGSSTGTSSASSVAAPPAPPSAAAPPITDDTPAPIDSPRIVPSAEAAPTAKPSAVASSDPAPVKSTVKPARTASTPAAPPPPKKATVSCSPPFTIDASGVKRAKPECL